MKEFLIIYFILSLSFGVIGIFDSTLNKNNCRGYNMTRAMYIVHYGLPTYRLGCWLGEVPK